MESWTEHLREVVRLSDDDRRLLAEVAVFQQEAERPTRYLAVDPHECSQRRPRSRKSTCGSPVRGRNELIVRLVR